MKKKTNVIDYETRKAEQRARRKATPGTPSNLGAHAFLQSIPTPEGFSRTEIAEREYHEHADGDWPAVEFEGDGISIVVALHDAESDWAPGSGHTTYETAHGRRTNDRRGIEDSFYVDADDTGALVAAKIERELKDVAQVRAEYARSERIPGMPEGGWTVTPEEKIEISAKLQRGKAHEFRPAGFGTGYLVSTRRTRFSSPLAAVTAAFFGVRALHYERTDCD